MSEDNSKYMDYPEHDATYKLFIKLFKWGTVATVVLMVFLALFRTG